MKALITQKSGFVGPHLATNEPNPVGLLTLIELAGIEAEIVEDSAKVRPADESSPRLDMIKMSGLGFGFEKGFKDAMAEELAEWINRQAEYSRTPTGLPIIAQGQSTCKLDAILGRRDG